MTAIFLTGLLFIVECAFQSLFLAWPTMLLWNALLPNIFGLPVISFWQALGLCLLARFLFGTGASGLSKKE
jgi:hypothetical protein